MKKCNVCKKNKSLSDFHKNKSNKDGLSYACRECKSLAGFKYRNKDPERYKKAQKRNRDNNLESGRNSYIKYTFSITTDDYNKLLQEQNSNCAICGINQSQLNYRLCIDHCHKTGKIRGLLCKQCNLSLGLFRDNINTLEVALGYLKKHAT